jgi:hypothetical protein
MQPTLLSWAGLLYNAHCAFSSLEQRIHRVLREVNKVRKVVNFLAGFFLGGLTGAAVGLLLAPRRGSELQKQIRARIDALVEEGERAAAARRAELENQLEAFKRGESPTAESTSQHG